MSPPPSMASRRLALQGAFEALATKHAVGRKAAEGVAQGLQHLPGEVHRGPQLGVGFEAVVDALPDGEIGTGEFVHPEIGRHQITGVGGGHLEAVEGVFATVAACIFHDRPPLTALNG